MPHQISYKKGIPSPLPATAPGSTALMGNLPALGKQTGRRRHQGKFSLPIKREERFCFYMPGTTRISFLTTVGCPMLHQDKVPADRRIRQCRRTREHTGFKITSKRSGSWFSKESWVKLSLRDVTSHPSTNPTLIKHSLCT